MNMLIELGSNENNVGEITRGVLIQQTFLPKHSYLKSLSIEFGTYCKSTQTSDIILQVIKNGNVIKSIRQPVKLFPDNKFYRFEMDLEVSSGLPYDIRLYSDNSNYGNAVTVKYGKPSTNHWIMVNGVRRRGELHCLFEYNSEEKELTNLSGYQRISGLGDILVTLPVIKQLSKNKKICYYTRYPELLENNPYITKTIQTDKEVTTAINFSYQQPYDKHASIFDYWDKVYKVNTNSNYYRGEVYLNEYEESKASSLAGDYVAVHLEVSDAAPVKDIPHSWKEEILKDLANKNIKLKLFGIDKSIKIKHENIIDLRGLSLRESLMHFAGCMSFVGVPSFFWHLSRAFCIPANLIMTGYEDENLMDREFSYINKIKAKNVKCKKYPCLLLKENCKDIADCTPSLDDILNEAYEFAKIKRKRAFVTGSLGDVIAMSRGLDMNYKWRFLLYTPAHKIVKELLIDQEITDDVIVLDDKLTFSERPITLKQWQQDNGFIIAEDLSIYSDTKRSLSNRASRSNEVKMRLHHNLDKEIPFDINCNSDIISKVKNFIKFSGEAWIFHRITMNTPNIVQRNFDQVESDEIIKELTEKNYKVIVVGTLADDKLTIPKNSNVLDIRGCKLFETLKVIELCGNYIGPVSGPSNWCWAKNINLHNFVLKKGFKGSRHFGKGAWHGYDNRNFYYPFIDKNSFAWFWDDLKLKHVNKMGYDSKPLKLIDRWKLPKGKYLLTVSCYNRFHIVKKSLESLANSNLPENTELILLDDGSDQAGMKEWLKNYNMPNVKMHYFRNEICALKRKKGLEDAWQYSRNNLIDLIYKIGKENYCCYFFLDDDALYAKNWMQRILMLWKENKDKSIKCYSGYHNYHPYGMEQIEGYDIFHESEYGWYRIRRWNAGVNYMIPADCFEEVGRFKINDNAGDIDLMYKARVNNWKAIVTVPSGIQHIGNTSILNHNFVDKCHDFVGE